MACAPASTFPSAPPGRRGDRLGDDPRRAADVAGRMELRGAVTRKGQELELHARDSQPARAPRSPSRSTPRDLAQLIARLLRDYPASRPMLWQTFVYRAGSTHATSRVTARWACRASDRLHARRPATTSRSRRGSERRAFVHVVSAPHCAFRPRREEAPAVGFMSRVDPPPSRPRHAEEALRTRRTTLAR